MARGDQALRQWKILTRIMSSSRYGVTQKQLLEAIQELEPGGKGKRTLQRDLQVLESAGFSIDRSGRTEDGEALYKPIKTFQEIPPILPTVKELVALAVARSLLSMYEGTPFKEDLDSFWQKIQPIFKREARESLEDALAMFGTLDRPQLITNNISPWSKN